MKNEHWHDKTNKITCAPREDSEKISLGIHPAWSWMDGWVRVLRPFNSISVISRPWQGEHEWLCAMKRRLGSGRISPPAGFEPVTPWSEVGRANRSATRTLPSLISLGCALSRLLRTHGFFMQTVKTLIRLGGCPGWSESWLGTQIILLVLSRQCSFFIAYYRVTFQRYIDHHCSLYLKYW